MATETRTAPAANLPLKTPADGGSPAPDAVAPPPHHPRFPLVDSLRAIAVLAVVAVHSAGYGRALTPSLGGRLLAHANIGVTIFFVLSGFLLYRPFVAARGGGAAAPATPDYFKRRFLRIYPAYWLALTVMLFLPDFVVVVGGNWLPMYSITHTLTSSGKSCESEFWCDLAQTWSLVVEVTFYLALPLLAWAGNRLTRNLRLRGWMWAQLAMLAALAAVSVALAYGLLYPPPSWYSYSLLGNMYWFGLGMALAVLSASQTSGMAVPRWLTWPGRWPALSWAFAAGLYLVLALWLPPTPFLGLHSQLLAVNLAFGLIAAALVAPAVLSPGSGSIVHRVLGNRVLAWLGLISYGIFLWHYSFDLLLGLGHHRSFWVVGGGTLLAAVGCASLSYYLVERPLLRLKYRRIGPFWRHWRALALLEGRVQRALSSPLLVPAAVTGLFLVALALRASQLHQSVFGDEVWTLQDLRGRGFWAVVHEVHTGGENSPPLFFVLSWLTAKLGHDTVTIRLPSLLLSSATVPVLYLLGRRAVGRYAALMAAAMYALSPFALFYGVEARMYATMVFFITVSTLALLHAVGGGRRGWWLLYAVSATAAAYTHYTAVFVLGAQAAWSLWVCRRRIVPALAANLLAALLYLPWLPHVRGKLLPVIGYLYPLSPGRVPSDWLRSLIGYASASLSRIPGTLGVLVIGACVLWGAARMLETGQLAWRRPRLALLDEPLVLIVVLAVVTPIGMLLYSVLATDIWLPRGLSASIPFGLMVMAALITRVPRQWAPAAAIVSLAALLFGTVRSTKADYQRTPYATLTAQLDRQVTARDRVMFASPLAEPVVEELSLRRLPVVPATPQGLLALAPGADAYLVLDDTFAEQHQIAIPPRFPGVTLVARRHYRGQTPTDLLVYRRNESRTRSRSQSASPSR